MVSEAGFRSTRRDSRYQGTGDFSIKEQGLRSAEGRTWDQMGGKGLQEPAGHRVCSAYLLPACPPAAQQVMPPPPTKRRRYVPEEGLPSQMETQGHMGAEAPGATEEVASSSSSTCSSSFPSSSNSSSCFPHVSSADEEVYMVSRTPSPLQAPESACPSPTTFASMPSRQSDGGSGCPMEEGLSTSQALPEGGSFPSNMIQDDAAHLVAFLLLKYLAKKPTTKAEMVELLGQDHQDLFPVIFSCASECLQLVFAIDVKEVDPSDHSYVLVTTMGLTCGRQLSDEQRLPKNSLLVLLLIIIFMRGGQVAEEEVWEMLGVMQICPGREHFIFGDPRELITRVWVQERYLEYQQVPHSDPARFQLLWGCRVHTETNIVKVLDFMAKFKDPIPNTSLIQYEEALRDQEGRGQPSIAAGDDAATVAGASSSVTSTGFCPE
ncbi:hypothetical protein MC885_010361 [Smutsia gigantea]|nr:hypothetical protein MC885_010361 [Smutsia gigantea]